MGRETVRVALALQGGGAHGAFTWGVLDRLLEEDWIEIDAISGASAGAMNAAALADGFAAGGHEGARRSLAAFWGSVADAATLSPFRRTPFDRLLGRWSLDRSPSFLALDILSRLLSPYEVWPPRQNPLAAVLRERLDFDRLRGGPIRLFVTATNVRTGRGRVFRTPEITHEALLASACLPTLFPAVEIDGEAYWDGGYSGNPTITPLVRESLARDTILVPVSPAERLGTPSSATEILNRASEISFNAGILKELRMMALLRKVADPASAEGARWAGMRVHAVDNAVAETLDRSSALNAEPEFLEMLREEGRAAASRFLRSSGDALGRRGTLPLDPLLDGV